MAPASAPSERGRPLPPAAAHLQADSTAWQAPPHSRPGAAGGPGGRRPTRHGRSRPLCRPPPGRRAECAIISSEANLGDGHTVCGPNADAEGRAPEYKVRGRAREGGSSGAGAPQRSGVRPPRRTACPPRLAPPACAPPQVRGQVSLMHLDRLVAQDVQVGAWRRGRLPDKGRQGPGRQPVARCARRQCKGPAACRRRASVLPLPPPPKVMKVDVEGFEMEVSRLGGGVTLGQ
jgi:hypothetical protein